MNREIRGRTAQSRQLRFAVFACTVLATLGYGASLSADNNLATTGTCAGQPPGCGTTAGTASSLAAHKWTVLSGAPLAPRTGQGTVWDGQDLLIWGGSSAPVANPAARVFADGAAYDAASKIWKILPPAPLRGRSDMSTLWIGGEAFFWGGAYPSGRRDVVNALNDGAAYDPKKQSWRTLPTSPLSPRSGATTVSAGNEAIVFGGHSAAGATLLDGATYDPSTRAWHPLPVLPARHFVSTGHAREKSGPVGTTAVWTGRELIVWVTYQVFSFPAPNTVGIASAQQAESWTPGSSTWKDLPSPTPGVFTYLASAIWAGSSALVIGGTYCLPAMSCAGPGRSNHAFDPASGQWESLPVNIVASFLGPAVWTGRAVVVFDDGSAETGPSGSILSPGDDAAYDDITRTWDKLPPCPVPNLDDGSVVWTGSQLVVWGGGGVVGSDFGASLGETS